MSEADTDSDHTRTAGSDVYPLLVRYAGFVAWPIAHFHPSHLPEIDSALTVLAGNEHFARPLEVATFQSLDASTLDLDEKTMAVIAGRREAQIALLAVTSTPADLELAANYLAAAILQRHLSTLLARAAREWAIAQLGPPAFQLGIREAHALYGSLQQLAPADLPQGTLEERPMTTFGIGWIHRFVMDAAPGLAPIFALRLPRGSAPPSRPFEPGQLTLAATMLRRKIAGWDQCTV